MQETPSGLVWVRYLEFPEASSMSMCETSLLGDACFLGNCEMELLVCLLKSASK